ncbi:hypothetical protein HID58_056024 [Brassica napus]|uniref:Replication factor A C-terminal domain-containing protein n=1 Tax=Brassica napus TaxID=3708 RepID=A0ABQ8AM35_BRANA|nr:hypothetical protein HID58_056024 [Brassica napus]
MASSAPAVVGPTSFDDLCLGRSAQFVVARLLRFWDSRNIKKQGKFMGITLLFLDEQAETVYVFHVADVVGMIRSVQGSDLSDATVMTRVVVRFVIEPNVVVYLSLWDEAAATFRGLISSGERAQSVMVVPTVNPKIFGGGPVGESFPCIDTKESIKKKEHVSIGDLNKFISNSDEQTQEAEFICKARVLEVLQQNGWSFVSCTGCSRKLDQSSNSLRCNRCVNANVTGVIKYRVELSVDDGNDNATFVVLDREMLNLIKKDAATLTVKEMNGGGGEQLP